MPITNAQKQERWRQRNQVKLTETPERIALELVKLDRAKLSKVVR
jgi:hypothetical protein